MVQEHVNCVDDVRRPFFVHRIKHPGRLRERQQRDPCAGFDESLGSVDLTFVVAGDAAGFERIADEDEETPAPAKGRKRAAKAEDKPEKVKKPKPPSKRAAASHGKFSKAKNKKATKKGELEDGEASVKESNDIAEMAVRRGGRGRKRTTKPKDGEAGEENFDEPQSVDTEQEMAAPADDARSERRDEPAEDKTEKQANGN